MSSASISQQNVRKKRESVTKTTTTCCCVHWRDARAWVCACVCVCECVCWLLPCVWVVCVKKSVFQTTSQQQTNHHNTSQIAI